MRERLNMMPGEWRCDRCGRVRAHCSRGDRAGVACPSCRSEAEQARVRLFCRGDEDAAGRIFTPGDRGHFVGEVLAGYAVEVLQLVSPTVVRVLVPDLGHVCESSTATVRLDHEVLAAAADISDLGRRTDAS